MTPWRAMLLAPLLAVAIIVLCLKAPDMVAWARALPGAGPVLQRAIGPNAGQTVQWFGVLCPAIPALLGITLFRALVTLYRDLKAQRIRARRQRERSLLEAPRAATVEQLARNKDAIDNRRKTI